MIIVNEIRGYQIGFNFTLSTSEVDKDTNLGKILPIKCIHGNIGKYWIENSQFRHFLKFFNPFQFTFF